MSLLINFSLIDLAKKFSQATVMFPCTEVEEISVKLLNTSRENLNGVEGQPAYTYITHLLDTLALYDYI